MKRRRRRCAWCSGKRPASATHRTRWPFAVWVEDEFEPDGGYLWVPPPVILLCSFHVRFARRYQGVRAYRLGGEPMMYATVPDHYAAELDAKTTAEPPPEGMAWSIAWDHLGRRPDLDALVPVHQPRTDVPAFPATLIVALKRSANSPEWLAATVPDDLSVPGISDRLHAYLGTPNPERDS